MKRHLISWLIRQLQNICPHDDCSADISDGCAIWRHDRTDYEIKYCRTCGAVQPGAALAFRLVIPDRLHL